MEWYVWAAFAVWLWLVGLLIYLMNTDEIYLEDALLKACVWPWKLWRQS